MEQEHITIIENINIIENVDIFSYLPNDLIIEILSRLPIQELNAVFRANPKLIKFMPRFEEELSEHYRPTVARIAFNKNQILEQNSFNQNLTKNNKPCLLSVKATRFMNLSFNENGKAIYTINLLYNWWFIYLLNNNLIKHGYVSFDKDMLKLFNISKENIQLLENMSINVFQTYLHNLIDCNVYIKITPELSKFLYQEKKELTQIRKITQKDFLKQFD